MQQLAFNNSIQNLEKAPESLSRSPVQTLGAQNKNRRNEPLSSYPAPPRGPLMHSRIPQVFPGTSDPATKQQRRVTAPRGLARPPAEGSALRRARASSQAEILAGTRPQASPGLLCHPHHTSRIEANSPSPQCIGLRNGTSTLRQREVISRKSEMKPQPLPAQGV